MKNAHPTPRGKAGGAGQGTAIVRQRAKAGNGAPTDLVTVEHGQPVTTTERVAAAAGVQHKNAIALVREHLEDFQEFGRVAFETRTFATAGGDQSREVAILNEPQSALLFTFLRNTKTVRAVKVRLVHEFFRVTAELHRLKAMQATPSWQTARIETKSDFCNVADMLQEVRADAGKPTARHHYINESKLLRFALTGSESEKWDRNSLTRDDLKLLGRVERLDMRLIARGMPFQDRKASCRALVLEARGLLLKGGAA